ncbi:hypothetical protein HMPREF9343_01083 [Cutibacterium acnes HL099PA1]|nr:hypothetical protein HMPREF9343_01083 [Cutibacterium acnes HL099PA1]
MTSDQLQTGDCRRHPIADEIPAVGRPVSTQIIERYRLHSD